MEYFCLSLASNRSSFFIIDMGWRSVDLVVVNQRYGLQPNFVAPLSGDHQARFMQQSLFRLHLSYSNTPLFNLCILIGVSTYEIVANVKDRNENLLR